MRRNRALNTSFKGIFKKFFHLVVKLAVTPKNTKNYFRFTRIIIISSFTQSSHFLAYGGNSR
jgi:hypothetical protein